MKSETKERLRIFLGLKLKEIGGFLLMMLIASSVIAGVLYIVSWLVHLISLSPEFIITILTYAFNIFVLLLLGIALIFLARLWIKDNWEEACKIEKDNHI